MVDRDGQHGRPRTRARRGSSAWTRSASCADNGSDPEWSFIDDDGAPLADARAARCGVTATTGEPQVARAARAAAAATASTRWLSVSTRAVETDRERPVHGRRLVHRRHRGARGRRRAGALQRRARRSSPTSPRTTCPSRCGWSRATSGCCAAATTAGWTRTRTSSSTTRSTAPRRMRTLIEALLAYSRAGRGERADRARSSSARSPPTCCARSPRRWSRRARRSRSATCPAVMGNRAQLEQLLQNLVANALKFRDDGRARVWVRAEGVGARDGADRGRRRRHRHRARRARARLRDVPAPARARGLRGHRHRPRRLPQDRRAPRRADLGRRARGRRHRLPVHASSG